MESQKQNIPRHMKEAEFVSTLKSEDDEEPTLDDEIKTLRREKRNNGN